MSQAQQAFMIVEGWNLRRSDFMSTLWKMKSKIDDLMRELKAYIEEIKLLFSIAQAMTIESDHSQWSSVYKDIKTKARAYEYIESLFKDCTCQMEKLNSYKNKTDRVADRIQLEEERYKTPSPFSQRIRDPSLDEVTSRSFIFLARQVCLSACELILEHKELTLDFQRSTISFQESCIEIYEVQLTRGMELKKGLMKDENKEIDSMDSAPSALPSTSKVEECECECSNRTNRKRAQSLESEVVVSKRRKEN